MEKIKDLKYIFFIPFITSSLFLWEVYVFNINFKYFILIAYIFIIIDLKSFIKKFYNFKILIFLFIFIHLYLSSKNNFSFYLFSTFTFLFLLSCLVIFFKNEIFLVFKKSIYLFVFILITAIVFYTFFTKNYLNPTFLIDFFTIQQVLFIENSHFAMISTSIIIFCLNEFLIKKQKIDLSIFLLMLLVNYLNFSLTSFAGIIFSCTFIIITNYFSLNRLQIISFILLIIFSATCIYNNSKNSYKVKSLKNNLIENFDDQSPDLSVDVFLTSYKIMINSVKEKPFGYGFNNYNQAFNEHINKTEYKHPYTPNLNKEDASNNFVKITTEMGIYSLIIFYFFILFSFSNKIELNYKLIIIPNFLVQTFFRGAGYFNGGYIIYLLLILILVYEFSYKNEIKNLS